MATTLSGSRPSNNKILKHHSQGGWPSQQSTPIIGNSKAAVLLNAKPVIQGKNLTKTRITDTIEHVKKQHIKRQIDDKLRRSFQPQQRRKHLRTEPDQNLLVIDVSKLSSSPYLKDSSKQVKLQRNGAGGTTLNYDYASGCGESFIDRMALQSEVQGRLKIAGDSSRSDLRDGKCSRRQLRQPRVDKKKDDGLPV